MKASNNNSKLKTVTARDIMTDDVSVIKEEMLVGQVAHLMLRERVGGYPIVDEHGKVCGIVTLTDLFGLLDKLVKESREKTGKGTDAVLTDMIDVWKNRPVKDIMSVAVITITPDTPLYEIIQAVVEHNFHTFPVMKDERLVGIVGRHDVLNAAFVYG